MRRGRHGRTWGRKPTNAIATGVRRSRSPRGDRNVVAEGGPTLEDYKGISDGSGRRRGDCALIGAAVNGAWRRVRTVAGAGQALTAVGAIPGSCTASGLTYGSLSVAPRRFRSAALCASQYLRAASFSAPVCATPEGTRGVAGLFWRRNRRLRNPIWTLQSLPF